MKSLFNVATLMLLSICFVKPSDGQTLTSAEVDAAVAAGVSGGKIIESDCIATAGIMESTEWRGSFNILARGPIAQIMHLSREGKREYKPITGATLPDDFRNRRLYVWVVPQRPSLSRRTWQQTAPAASLVLKRKDSSGDNPADILHPVTSEHLPFSWSNALGAKFEGQGIFATFDFDAFQAMPGTELDFVVVTDAGERRCKIGAKDRKALR